MDQGGGVVWRFQKSFYHVQKSFFSGRGGGGVLGKLVSPLLQHWFVLFRNVHEFIITILLSAKMNNFCIEKTKIFRREMLNTNKVAPLKYRQSF